MPLSQIPGNVMVEVLKEARLKFGPLTPENKVEYLAYVRTRVDAALKRKPQAPERDWTGDRS